MVHQDYKELLSVHALSALEPKDAELLASHIQECPECRAEMDQWFETAAMLACDAPLLEPLPEVRDRIFQNVNRSLAPTQVGGKNSEATNVVPMTARRKEKRSSWQSWMAIAAGLAFVAFVVSLFVLWSQNQAARQELASLASQFKNAQLQLARQREVIEIVTRPGTRTIELAGTEVAPDAHGTVAIGRNGGAVLLANNLPPVPEEKGYQLWFLSGGKPLPGKVFIPDETGNGTLEDQVPANVKGTVGFAITLEPKMGVTAPTGAIYLRSSQ